MLTILHASDLHFGKPFDPAPARALRQMAEDVSPDLIVLSGDFTQRAKIREYEEARAFIQGLPDRPIVVVPGNHDVPLYRVWERVFAPLRNYREYITTELDSVTRLPGATVVALNSTAPLRAIVNGRISDRQLLFAAEAFRDTPEGDLKMVVAHHHLASAPDYESDQVLPGFQRCFDAFAKMGVDLILGGHLHRGYVARSPDCYPGAEEGAGILIAHSGTTTSRRGRGRERNKNSLNLIGVSGDRMVVTPHLYLSDLSGFAPTSSHVFPRKNEPFLSSDPHGTES